MSASSQAQAWELGKGSSRQPLLRRLEAPTFGALPPASIQVAASHLAKLELRLLGSQSGDWEPA